jgi:hypothetical protein
MRGAAFGCRRSDQRPEAIEAARDIAGASAMTPAWLVGAQLPEQPIGATPAFERVVGALVGFELGRFFLRARVGVF